MTSAIKAAVFASALSTVGAYDSSMQQREGELQAPMKSTQRHQQELDEAELKKREQQKKVQEEQKRDLAAWCKKHWWKNADYWGYSLTKEEIMAKVRTVWTEILTEEAQIVADASTFPASYRKKKPPIETRVEELLGLTKNWRELSLKDLGIWKANIVEAMELAAVARVRAEEFEKEKKKMEKKLKKEIQKKKVEGEEEPTSTTT